jgi:hypothetical protein
VAQRDFLVPSEGPPRRISMTVQTFRELLTTRPFKPFRLVMSSGETYEVRHPEWLGLLERTFW